MSVAARLSVWGAIASKLKPLFGKVAANRTRMDRAYNQAR